MYVDLILGSDALVYRLFVVQESCAYEYQASTIQVQSLWFGYGSLLALYIVATA